MQPLKTCVDRSGGIVRYSNTIYDEHVLLKVMNKFYTRTGGTSAAVGVGSNINVPGRLSVCI